MSYQDIQFQIEDGVARLTLSRPDKLNSFTAAMHAEVRDVMDRVEAGEGGVRVLLLTGAGRGFCAGQDLGERKREPGAPPVDLGETLGNNYNPLIRRLDALAVPVLVGVNGVAAGAGANLALAGDIVIAKESASFIESFCRLGLLPDSGGTYVLPRLVGRARAMGMALLGDRISARQAEAWGLIWQCVPDEEFDATLDRLARQLAQAPTKGLVYTRRALRASVNHNLAEQLELERGMMAELGRSEDYAEGVAAFIAKREPVSKGR